jgi:hypothetical protein
MSSVSDPPPGSRGSADPRPEAPEEAVRQALRDAAWRLEPPPWPAEAVRGRARRRRVRGIVLAAPLAAAVAVAAVLLLPPQPHDPPMPAASPTRQPEPGPTAERTASPLLASPGKKLKIGHGAWLTLTTEQVCLGFDGPAECDPVGPGNQPSGTIGLRIQSDSTGTLYRPLYIGPGEPVRITLRVGSASYQARLVTLPGRPGYATGYVWTSARSGTALPSAVVTAYGAQGQVLATFRTAGP